jgi:hypothetical protein
MGPGSCSNVLLRLTSRPPGSLCRAASTRGSVRPVPIPRRGDGEAQHAGPSARNGPAYLNDEHDIWVTRTIEWLHRDRITLGGHAVMLKISIRITDG